MNDSSLASVPVAQHYLQYSLEYVKEKFTRERVCGIIGCAMVSAFAFVCSDLSYPYIRLYDATNIMQVPWFFYSINFMGLLYNIFDCFTRGFYKNI